MTTNADCDEGAEIADVAIHVSDIRPVRGRGNITHECTALIDIAGIPITLFGVTLRNDRPREVGAYLPQHRGADGVWRPSIGFPAAVERALAQAALEQTGNAVITSRTTSDAAEAQDA